MTSIIQFTPLCGAHSEDPLCYLLEIDECRILLDCGWDDNFDVNLLKPLKRVVGKINAVLVSHPDLEHLGALPYAVGKLGLKANIYATVPTYKMGQMFMYDSYQSRKSVEEFETFDLDDVDAAFDNFVQLKYSQRISLSEKGVKIEITPYAAGHMVGGTIWQIKREADVIVYAVDYNHKKERHLNPTILETLSKPTLLITDAQNALNTQLSRRVRDAQLHESISSTFRNGGNILFPIDTAGRVLELLVVLEQNWVAHQRSQPIILLNNVSFNVVEFAKSQLEWMSEAIGKKFITSRENAFVLKHVHICHKLSELKKFTGPIVVLCSMPSLHTGFAQDLFSQWAADENNTVIFTDRSRPNSIARKLMENTKIGSIYLEKWKRVPLVGQELIEYEKAKKLAEELALAQKKAEEEKANKERMHSDMHHYEGEDTDVKASLGSLWRENDLHINIVQYERSRLANETNEKEMHLPYPMFPSYERRSLYDEYGEIIRQEDFVAIANRAAKEEADLFGEDVFGMDVEEDGADEASHDEDIPVGPTKCVLQSLKVSVACKIQYIDFEGRSDGRSIKKILTHVQPRKLVLIHGGPEATSHLATYCSKTIDGVHTPHVGETVDVTEATDLYRLHLKSNFLESLNFVPVSGKTFISYVDGVVMVPVQEIDEDGRVFQPEPYLDILPSQSGATGHPAIYVGDVKLSNFRQKLHDCGFRAEFKGGALIVNGTVALRREQSQGAAPSIHVEGPLSEDYYKVRELLYSQYHIL